MTTKMIRFFLFLLFLPVRLPWDILFNSSYRDKVFFYTYQKSSYDLLNGQPANEGVTSIPVDGAGYPASGGGILGRRGRLIIEGGGLGGGALQREGDYLVQVAGAGGGVSLGLLPRKGSRLRIYPLVGIGGGGGGISVRQDKGATVLSSGLADVSYHVGIAVDLVIGWRLGLMVGARIGLASPIIGAKFAPFVRFVGGAGWFGKDRPPRTASKKSAPMDETQPVTSSTSAKRELEPQA
jgi:hypothetical protein